MRKFKPHEKRLLRKVDFLKWDTDNIASKIVKRKYNLSSNKEYNFFNRTVGLIKKLHSVLSHLDNNNKTKKRISESLVYKLQELGVMKKEDDFESLKKMTVSDFLERQITFVMKKIKIGNSVKENIKLIKTGQVKLGSKIVTNDKLLIPKKYEKFIELKPTGKISKSIKRFYNKDDDYEF